MEQKIPDEIRQLRERNLLEAEDYKMDIGYVLYLDHCKNVRR
jgi:hypothetical protein